MPMMRRLESRFRSHDATCRVLSRYSTPDVSADSFVLRVAASKAIRRSKYRQANAGESRSTHRPGRTMAARHKTSMGGIRDHERHGLTRNVRVLLPDGRGGTIGGHRP